MASDSLPEVIIDSTEGRRLELGPGRSPYGDGEPWAYDARLVGPSFEAIAGVYDLGRGLAEFFDGIASCIAGWEGERTYASLESQLRLRASHDGKGQITLHVEVGSPEPPGWTASAELTIGGGAHAERIAQEVRRMVSASAIAD
jgi:hypothetical protein